MPDGPGPRGQDLLDQKQYTEAYQRLRGRRLVPGAGPGRRGPQAARGPAPAQRAMELANEDATMEMEHRTTYLATVGTLGPDDRPGGDGLRHDPRLPGHRHGRVVAAGQPARRGDLDGPVRDPRGDRASRSRRSTSTRSSATGSPGCRWRWRWRPSRCSSSSSPGVMPQEPVAPRGDRPCRAGRRSAPDPGRPAPVGRTSPRASDGLHRPDREYPSPPVGTDVLRCSSPNDPPRRPRSPHAASTSSSNMLSPNLTPLLDVVLQLITFFMMLVHFGSRLEGADRAVRLPVGPGRPAGSDLTHRPAGRGIDAGGLLVDGQVLEGAARRAWWADQAEPPRRARALEPGRRTIASAGSTGPGRRAADGGDPPGRPRRLVRAVRRTLAEAQERASPTSAWSSWEEQP